MTQPLIEAFFDEPTNTISYLVGDPATRTAAVIDPVLDFDMASGEMASLPGMMIDQRSGSVVGLAEERLWGAALTLILLVAVLNVLAKLVAKFFSPKAV